MSTTVKAYSSSPDGNVQVEQKSTGMPSNLSNQKKIESNTAKTTSSSKKNTTSETTMLFNPYDYAPRRSTRGRESGLVWSKELVLGKGMLLVPEKPEEGFTEAVPDMSALPKIRAPRTTKVPSIQTSNKQANKKARKRERQIVQETAGNVDNGNVTTGLVTPQKKTNVRKEPVVPAAERVLNKLSCVLGSFWNEELTPRARKRREFLSPGAEDSSCTPQHITTPETVRSGAQEQVRATPEPVTYKKVTPEARRRRAPTPVVIPEKKTRRPASKRLKPVVLNPPSKITTQQEEEQQVNVGPTKLDFSFEEAPRSLTKRIESPSQPVETEYSLRWKNTMKEDEPFSDCSKLLAQKIFAPTKLRSMPPSTAAEIEKNEVFQTENNQAWNDRWANSTTSNPAPVIRRNESHISNQLRLAQALHNNEKTRIARDQLKPCQFDVGACGYNMVEACQTMLMIRSGKERMGDSLWINPKASIKQAHLQLQSDSDSHMNHQLIALGQLQNQYPIFRT